MKINKLVVDITLMQRNKGHFIFWNKSSIKNENDLTVGEALCMAAGELNGEAMEAYRDNNKALFAIKLADAVLRICHIVGDVGINDFEKVIQNKMEYNKTRTFKHGRKNF